jgi:hypothetical protein
MCIAVLKILLDIAVTFCRIFVLYEVVPLPLSLTLSLSISLSLVKAAKQFCTKLCARRESGEVMKVMLSSTILY